MSDFLAAVVEDFINTKRSNIEEELRCYREERDLNRVLEWAAHAENDKGIRYAHQYRVRQSALEDVKASLTPDVVEGVQHFDELYERVHWAIGYIERIGELMVYDTCERIGAHLDIWPDKVYLHSGVREGAKYLGLTTTAMALEKHVFPAVFQSLECYEIKNLLGLYKEAFKYGMFEVNDEKGRRVVRLEPLLT
ncbi:hypothetical protein [Pleionea sp. CnH1-48]|uniref:hypothetical protein n=1 Tax=Pleionea sp. CnH1-48 TaxID=2954494 RepID=UPI002097584D|nr:hypothetical protein [Pleionea sp. CnH1-48]MCO7224922.1 hypothetical protein [Pleionea sp. CnH1-48]